MALCLPKSIEVVLLLLFTYDLDVMCSLSLSSLCYVALDMTVCMQLLVTSYVKKCAVVATVRYECPNQYPPYSPQMSYSAYNMCDSEELDSVTNMNR